MSGPVPGRSSLIIFFENIQVLVLHRYGKQSLTIAPLGSTINRWGLGMPDRSAVDKKWTAEAQKHLQGKRIVRVRYMTKKEHPDAVRCPLAGKYLLLGY